MGTRPKRYPSRSSLISKRIISLQASDPLERLKELCKQGKYNYSFNWDRFANGFMCECVVSYSLRPKTTKILKKEVFWIETNDLTVAQRTVATILLDGIGLGIPQQSEVDELHERKIPLVIERFSQFQSLSGMSSDKSWAEMVEEDD